MTRNKIDRSLVVKISVLIALTVSAVTLAFLMKHEAISEIEIKPHCDISKSKCDFKLPEQGGGRVEIDPLPLQSAKRFSISILDLTFQPDRIEVDISGIDMNMGYNRPTLQAVDNGYRVETIFPTCTVDKMPWKITLFFYCGDQVYSMSWVVEVSR